ncbi:NTPase [Reticulomyxa filosa]|uniref:NTPase n=1 Tax=Reticulomyxa filosa TaxID=46433 RepID=X6MND9_RETFI|nr:NTPase [Reticulomyxa filosa]|eukprot:ETO14922.1 NTPase [Reticulomyxa filosa]
MLLVLDGFDEIANELHIKASLRQWLQHCTESKNYCVIMTSRPNSICPYLDKKARRLNVIGFQKQDIQNYVRAYFQNISSNDDNSYEADRLIKTLINNPSLQLLSHTPLYLRLFCYLASQQMIEMKEERKEDPIEDKSFDELHGMSVSKLYEKLLVCYMKWNWIKLNGTKDKPNEQAMFKIFEMEMYYLSQLAWKGLKCGQVVISSDIQEKVLNATKIKYPRKHISITSQWSRIHSFGFLQGQESVNVSYPNDPVYFPHLTFQEWLAAYYLSHCLYGSTGHKEARSILIDEQLTPKYSIMIPFMAGILYGYIENKKDVDGSGLLYFWKLLHSSLPPLTSSHQMIYKQSISSIPTSNMSQGSHPFVQIISHCLDQLRQREAYAYGDGYRIVHRPFDRVIELHLPNLRYVLLHPDIHECIMEQLSQFQTRLNKFDKGKLIDRLRLLPYLCVSAKTAEVIMEYYHKGFQHQEKYIRDIYMDALETIALKVSELQVDNVFEVVMNGFHDQNIYIHRKCAKALERISWNMNEGQLDTAFKHLIDIFRNGQMSLCDICANTLGTIAVKLGAKQVDCTLDYIMSGLNDKDVNIFVASAIVLKMLVRKLDGSQLSNIFKHLLKGLKSTSKHFPLQCAKLLEAIAMQLNEKQLDIVFQFLMDGLQDRRKVIRRCCVKLLGKLSMKWNQVQLGNAFQCLMDGLIDHKDKYVHWPHRGSYQAILTQLNIMHLDVAFNYLMRGLKHEKRRVRKLCVDFLAAMSMKWNQIQLDTLFICLIKDMSKDEHKYVRYSCAQAIQRLVLLQFRWNDKSFRNDVFDYLMDGLQDANKNLQSSCAEAIGKIATKLDKRQLNIAGGCLKNKLKDKREDILVRMSCAESIGRIALQLNAKQLDGILKCLIDGTSDNESNTFVRKYCACSLERLLTRWTKTDLTKHVRRLFGESPETILTKCKEKQFDNTINGLVQGFEEKDEGIRHHCVESLAYLLTNLHGKQLDNGFRRLMKGLDAGNWYCAETIRRIALQLDATQLKDLLHRLEYGFHEKDYLVRNSCAEILRTISAQLDQRQMASTFKVFIHGFNNAKGNIRNSCAKALVTIIMRLDDEQLWELMQNFLQSLKVSDWEIRKYVNQKALEISDDMWQRVTMAALKENIRMKREKNSSQMELLAFGLLTYNPRIQFHCNDSYDHENIITPDAIDGLRGCCNKQAMEWNFPTQQKWSDHDTLQIKLTLQDSNDNEHNERYATVHEAAKLGDISRLKSALECYCIDINDTFNKHGQALLHVAIYNSQWNVARYCIERGAWIDVRGVAPNATALQTPLEYIIGLMNDNKTTKNLVEMCKWILRKRVIFPMRQIEYAIDYVKDRLMESYVGQSINLEDYKTLMQEGASFLLGVHQGQLQKMLINCNLHYWATARNVTLIKTENSNKKRFDEGWYPIQFLRYRIFLLFEICVRLKREGRTFIELPKNTTFEQLYEKGTKELQVQLTTYWDHITATKIQNKCPELLDDWSCNVVDRLVRLKPTSFNNNCCEMSLMVGHKSHSIYLSLCKTSSFILVRIDNRWMQTVPSNTPHPSMTTTKDNNFKLIQPYVAAYFPCNSVNISQNKKWLKDYIKKASKLKNSKHKQSMAHFLPSIAKDWPYRPVQTDANNCYLRGHNVGYRIRLGGDGAYEWFRDQEGKSFVFNRSHHNKGINKKD